MFAKSLFSGSVLLHIFVLKAIPRRAPATSLGVSHLQNGLLQVLGAFDEGAPADGRVVAARFEHEAASRVVDPAVALGGGVGGTAARPRVAPQGGHRGPQLFGGPVV